MKQFFRELMFLCGIRSYCVVNTTHTVTASLRKPKKDYEETFYTVEIEEGVFSTSL